MEIHANFYFKHPEPKKHKLLEELLTVGDLNSKERILDINERTKKIIEIAEQINPDNGKKLSQKLLSVFDSQDSFGSESIKEFSGYCVSHWVNSSIGFEVQEYLMHFIYKLCPEVHAQSWVCGDDEPVEGWFKYENGQVYLCTDTAYSDNDNIILGTIYRWWHSTMPNAIKEGFLNDKEAYHEINQEIHGGALPPLTNIPEKTYIEWLSDKSNRTTAEYTEVKQRPLNHSNIEDSIHETHDAIIQNKEHKTSHVNNATDYSELKDKLNCKSILQLIIFLVSLAWLVWVYLLK